MTADSTAGSSSERADTERAVIPTLADYPHHMALQTRWMDNDIYGHVNNVTYYSYFDTVANAWMVAHGLDIQDGPVIGVVAESTCRYHREIAFPDALMLGLRIDKLGNRAVTWGIGIFREGESQAVAHGTFVHVFVGRDDRRPVVPPEPLATALKELAEASGRGSDPGRVTGR
ncbi:acyl-CoA thioesterase [Nocardioides sp. Kera G14]|uniref:acyl-CoA thioesterase n=1 Tax=Nocardioides sp. Kera G14 TaxID=2884264 RepID=UPI001D0F993C|nr:thioesterase family protein [Nocardioides sp. Kera G14]UDY23284.1 acyl-CoA thioesterase [Nocardioides sp. Kera G14]